MSNENFEKEVLRLAQPSGRFEPVAYYDEDGDCIEFLISNDDYYAERVDELLTVYYSRDKNEIIGSLIKGVRKLYQNVISKLPGFAIEIQDGKVRIAHLFRAKLWTEQLKQTSGNTILVKTYQKLADCADEFKAEAEASFV
ncbi:MAG: hypothetical protein NTW06_05130 [Candidatus Falkowbacteria bacterium]|nr:hypothetical protein [Candidatus Falkowbacteria bacterium]